MGSTANVQAPELPQPAPVSASIVVHSTPQGAGQDPDCQRAETDNVMLLVVGDTGVLLGVEAAAVPDDGDHVGEADILDWHLAGEMIQQLDLVRVGLLLCQQQSTVDNHMIYINVRYNQECFATFYLVNMSRWQWFDHDEDTKWRGLVSVWS